MASCCNPRGYETTFTDRSARRQANRYRKRGLDKTARRIVELVAANGVDGATVLEIGGGIGEIQLELLKRGAARTVNLELSAAYDAQAQRLLADAGLTSHAERRIVDIATHPEDVAPADIVVLHRVVCCYPDYVALLAAVADHAQRLVVFSHPPRNVVSRAVLAAENVGHRLRRSDFRVYAHPPKAMLAVLADHGLTPQEVDHSGTWHIATATR